MITPSQRIEQALVYLLDGVISYGGNSVPVYSTMPPLDSTDPIYIIVDGFTQGNNLGTKLEFVSDGTFLVGVWSRQDSDFVDKRGLDYVTSEVLRLMQPSPQSQFNLRPEFNCISLYLEQDIYNTSLVATERVVRRLLRWNFALDEGWQNDSKNADYTVENVNCVNTQLRELREIS